MIVQVLAFALLLLVLLVLGLVAFTGWAARKAEAAVPPVGRFVTVNGLRLHYVDIGTGPIVLMLHGLASQLQSFTYALEPLLSDRYRLIILDRPGNGYSQAAQTATLRAQADLIAGFLDELGIERAIVVGHSLGGAVALALAVEHPKRVAALALIAPATQHQEEVPKALRGLALRSRLARLFVGWTIAVPAALFRQKNTLKSLFAPDPIAPEFGTRGGAMLPLRPHAFRHASRDLVEVADGLAPYAARHGNLKMPIGVLFGTGDNILDYRMHGESLAAHLPDLDLELVHGGHMLPLTQPQTSAAFIDRIGAKTDMDAHRAVSPAS